MTSVSGIRLGIYWVTAPAASVFSATSVLCSILGIYALSYGFLIEIMVGYKDHCGMKPLGPPEEKK